jgi:hypothetical protein
MLYSGLAWTAVLNLPIALCGSTHPTTNTIQGFTEMEKQAEWGSKYPESHGPAGCLSSL